MIRKRNIITIFFGLVVNCCVGQTPRLVLPIGHTNAINHGSFSPDGKKVVTVSTDRNAILWDAESGYLLTILSGHSKPVYSVCFSPDGTQIATSSQDSTVRIWDAITGSFIFSLKGHKGDVYFSSFSPDSKKIVTGSGDRTARIWDASTGTELKILAGHTDDVPFCAFNQDGSQIITTSFDHTAKTWSTQTGKQLSNLQHNKVVRSAQFSYDNKTIITGSSDSTAKIWNAGSGSLLFVLKGHNKEVISVEFSRDGKKIMTVSEDKTIKLWDAANGTLIRELPPAISLFTHAKFSGDSKRVIAATVDNLLELWDIETGKLLTSFSQAHRLKISSISFSPDEKKILTTSADNEAKIWDPKSGGLVTTLAGHTSHVLSVEYSSDGKHFITALSNNLIKVWDVSTIKPVGSIKDSKGDIYSVRFSPDGKKIITASTDKSAKIWDVRTCSLLVDLAGHASAVYDASFNSDGSKVITACEDGTIKMWNLNSMELIKELKHDRTVSTALLSSDEKTIVGTAEDGIIIWDVLTGTQRFELSDPFLTFSSATFTPDNKKIIALSSDSKIKIWDLKTGSLLLNLAGHSTPIYSLTFSRDGYKLISSSRDGKARIWDLRSGKLLKQLVGHTGAVMAAAFSPDGKKIITASADNTSKLWNSQTGKAECTFFLVDSTDYFIQVPEGFYMCTAGAAKLLHYTTDNLLLLTFEQLDVKYNRPDKVLAAIGNTDTALIKSYRQAWEKRIKKLGIDTSQFREDYKVPEAEISNREKIRYEQSVPGLKVDIKAIDSNYNLDRFNIWVNEVPIYGQRGISLRSKGKRNLDTAINISLSDNLNRIEISVTNVNGIESYRMPLYVNYTPPKKEQVKLYFIGIGIDQFADITYNLNYSVKDIRDLAASMKAKNKDIRIDTLFNSNVTIEKVKMLKDKLKETGVNDKVILAFSGHGLLSDSMDYYLSTYSVNFKKPEEYGLPYEELENLFDSIPARRKLMLIDACHSGEVDKDDLVRKTASSDTLIKGLRPVAYRKDGQLGLKNSFELMQSLFVNVGKSTGATIISAAAGTQFALERGDLKNGVFTYSILEAMNKYASMKITQLKKIVSERVEYLTKGLQKPTSRNETIAVDWNIW